jgi:hypothetical protein
MRKAIPFFAAKRYPGSFAAKKGMAFLGNTSMTER